MTCAITAGIGLPEAGQFRDRSSGWFVFCNGRAVISADKTQLTGWGGAGLPIFQPKHRPFLGTVFFVSKNPEHLPWTTTKSAINEDSALWQATKRQMATVGRVVVSFLDGRYTDEGSDASSKAGQFRDRSSGWFVFCNGRAVISADKTQLTGWGGAGLPIFQPKHRPFLGTVFFVSKNPEHLPWTTTKSAINEDSALWQATKRQMATVGRVVVSFLDGRYTDEGSDASSKEIRNATGNGMSVLSAAVAEKRAFITPRAGAASSTTRIQYDAKVAEVTRIAKYLKRPSMSGSEVGRHTFSHFLRNEVDEK